MLLSWLGTILVLPCLGISISQGQGGPQYRRPKQLQLRQPLEQDTYFLQRSRRFSSRKNETISLWGGRIIVSMENKGESKAKKTTKRKMKLCVSSDNEIGLCTRMSFCRNFKISKLHNNICFMDVFVPGVCCVEKPDSTDGEDKIASSNSTSDTADTNKMREDDDGGVVEFLNEDCGHVPAKFSSRIIHGDTSPAGKWPWMAAIYTLTILGRIFHCGGSLVSDTHVVTGTHCLKDRVRRTFDPQQIEVRLGDNDISTTNEYSRGEPGRFYDVEKIIPHPKFRNINHYFMNDVAVVKLKKKVVFSDTLSPVCLPSPSAIYESLDKFKGRYATVIGFGKTETGRASGKLLEAKVPIWGNRECDASYFAPITDIFICAGYKEGGIDACQGDSGGPLLLFENNRWLQIGITSFGKGCGEAGYPGVYARVGKFSHWLKENLL